MTAIKEEIYQYVIDYTTIEDCIVSTIGFKFPISSDLYETAVFSPQGDVLEGAVYADEQEAKRGHRAIVKEWKQKLLDE